MAEQQAFTAEGFARFVGAHFVFVPPSPNDGAGSVALELVEVTGGKRIVAPGGEHFALLFRSVGGKTLGPGLHTLTHENFAPTPVFVERVQLPGEARDAVFYEAIFNRLGLKHTDDRRDAAV